MNTNRFTKWALAAAMGIALTLASPLTAMAGTGGGTGGGGGGGGTTTGFQWNSIGYDEPGKAWAEFQTRAGNAQSTIINQVTKRVGNTEVCEQSNVIWYIYTTTNNHWVYNFTGATHGSAWSYPGSIENPAWQFGQRGPNVGEIQAFYNWDATENGHQIDSKPGYTIICSGAFAMPDITWSDSTDNTSTSTTSQTFTHPYAWSTEVKRQVTANGGDPIGANNLHDQGGTPVKSNFGLLWDSLNTAAGQGLSPDQLASEVNAALAKDQALEHGSVALDDQNKAGMAEGGVLNVYEQTQYATLSSVQTTTTVTTTVCDYVQKWDSNTGAYGEPTKTCTNSDKVSNASTATKVNGTLQNTGFWQMLSVHCNQDGFNALVAAGNGIKVVESGDPSKAISAVAYTKRYDRQPNMLDFGDASNPNPAMAATGNLGFYDKECPFDCTADPAGSGASNSNGAKTNVVNTNVASGSKGGAVSDGTNSNFFEFFRNNEAKTITADVWYPKSEGVVSYDGQSPVTTTVTRWSEGTPDVASTSGGKFTMTTKDGKTTLFTGGTPDKNPAPTQKNWDSAKFSNSTTTILSGLQRDFNVKASWASEANRPQVLNLKWEYAPLVSTNIFDHLGFGAQGSQKTGGTTTVSTPIQGKCYANFGTTDQASTVDLFQKNTGTDTTNGLDGVLLQGAGNGSNARQIQSNLVVNFIRSTTE